MIVQLNENRWVLYKMFWDSVYTYTTQFPASSFVNICVIFADETQLLECSWKVTVNHTAVGTMRSVIWRLNCRSKWLFLLITGIYLPERKQHLLLLAWPLRLPWDQWPLVSDVSYRLISQQDKWVSSRVPCLGLFPFLRKCPVIFPMTHTQLSLTKPTWTIPSDHCSFSSSSLELVRMATRLFCCACHGTKTAKCTWNDF